LLLTTLLSLAVAVVHRVGAEVAALVVCVAL
jgi:hypothetical protein